MSRTRHHRRRPRREVCDKAPHLRHKVSKKSVSWYATWPPYRSTEELEWVTRLIRRYEEFIRGSNPVHIDFRPWHFQDLKPMFEEMFRRRGTPFDWYLGDSPAPPGWVRKSE